MDRLAPREAAGRQTPRAGLRHFHVDYVEHPQLVAKRNVLLREFVGRERVMAGADCGFGTFAGIGKMDAGISWPKLRALAEGPQIATRRMWAARDAVGA